jgi:cysteine-rich secretory family protein
LLNHTLRFTGVVLLHALAAAQSPNADSLPASSWLERVNFYRASAALPPVVEDPALSGAVWQHARYMVMHGVVRHSENRRDRGATPEGAAAAAVSNLAGSIHAGEPDSWAVDVWMQAPFHAIGILDPALKQVGFGIHRALKGKVQTAAGLDVIRGRSVAPVPAAYPIVWPGDGSSVSITSHTSESPSPLTSCPGYDAPTGLPLIVQLGSDGALPHVTDSWIADDKGPLEHCVFDGGTYRNRDAGQERLGRTILGLRNAIVLIPRRPLGLGSGYRAIVDVNGQRIEWKFRVEERPDRLLDALKSAGPSS